MRILVVGGAGYVGSTSVETFIDAGHDVTVYDNLKTGHRDAVIRGARLIVGSLSDQNRLERVLREHRIQAVLHCAARSLVSESMEHPELYYRENVSNGVKLLEALRERRVPRIVFSSTAAVYGEPKRVPIAEADRTEPINPYGETKLAFEGAMRWYAACHGFRAISLRYFNVAGATERNGEDHDPETHLIPIVLKVAAGELPDVRIFGQDYNTPDGTCIRDYIHVRDLASAHLLALEATGEAEPSFEVYNLGSAAGFSVREVIEAARKVTGRAIPARVVKRRVGDPPSLVASSRRARRDLGWQPREASLEQMLADAWAWKLSHPTGYAKRKPRTPSHHGRSGAGDGASRGRGADGEVDGVGPAEGDGSSRTERVAVPVTG